MDISILKAAELISQEQVIAVPTETVYGLAASLTKPAAIDQIFALKGRPANNPLIIHVAEVEDILPFLIDVNEDFLKIAKFFWPGPLTLVLPINEEMISSRVRANLTTAAFRIPGHKLARDLLKLTGPLVMPSANLSGKPSATSRMHVESDFGKDFPVLDGGPCVNGLESTILYKDQSQELNPWKIIRQGALTQGDFRQVLGYLPEIVIHEKQAQVICPGQLYRHYAPKAKLKLVTKIEGEEGNDEGVILGFDEVIYPEGYKVYSLGSLNKPETISNNLYRVLRQLDDDGVKEALVDINFEVTGIMATVLERLKKASSGT